MIAGRPLVRADRARRFSGGPVGYPFRRPTNCPFSGIGTVYTYAYDGDALMLVHLFAGTSSTDAEYEEMIEGWRRLYQRAGRRAVFAAVVVEAGHPPPNAHWRRRIVEVESQAMGPISIAIVTESALIRGVITATTWMKGPRENHETRAFATLELGAAYFEKASGRSMDRLRSLYAEALGRLQRGAPHAAAS